MFFSFFKVPDTVEVVGDIFKEKNSGRGGGGGRREETQESEKQIFKVLEYRK